MGPLGHGFEIPKSGRQVRAILVAGGMGVVPMVMLAEKIKSVVSRQLAHKGEVSPIWGGSSVVSQKTKQTTIDSRLSTVAVLIGARTRKELLCEDEFKKLGCEVKVRTEDGSKGFKGLVTDLFVRLLSTIDYSPRSLQGEAGRLSTVIYACGPKPMLKKIAEISQRYKISAQVSMEESMACGVGACYGCPVRTKDGYKLICKDGPVFDANDIVWE